MILWTSIIGIIFTITEILEKWQSDYAKQSIFKVINISVFRDIDTLINSVNNLFLKLFDRIYKYSNTSVNRNIYRSIIFCYVFFFVMKFSIQMFDLKMPPTEYILLTILIISSYTVLIYKSFTGTLQVLGRVREEDYRLEVLISLMKDRKNLLNVLLYSLCLSFFTVIVMKFTSYFGDSIKTYIVFISWTILVVFFTISIMIIPAKYFKINPIRSFISSILFMVFCLFFFLYFNEWEINKLSLPKNSPFLLLSFLTFNLFGDLISSQETRWILMLSQRKKLVFFPFLLILDIILSALIFLVLPLLSNTSISSIFQSLVFKGETPWMGILFWSSFFTSLFYYLYIIAILIMKLFFPLYQKFDKWFDVLQHPIRFIGFTSMFLFSLLFVLYEILI